MGRYTSVQAYGDNNPKIASVAYDGGEDRDGNPQRSKIEKLENVTGSTAGASSSSFHIYRAHRRTEMARLAEMEEKATAEEEQKIYEESMERKRKESEERTRKLAEKRRRRRLAKKQRRGHGEVLSSNGRDEDGSMDEEDKDLSETIGKKQCVSENNLCMPIVQIKDDGNFMQMMLALKKDRRGGQTRNT